jgi:elongation factor G
MGFKEGCQKANPVLLEPIMKIEIVTPEEYLGDVLGDFNARRGKVEGMEVSAGAQVIRGFVPMAQMFGYATVLRSLSQGRAIYTIYFSHYEEVPTNLAKEIIQH